MTQTLTLTTTNKTARYAELFPQIQAVVAHENDRIANMANISAMLHEAFDWLWIGFYRVDEQANELVLGSFQGPLACSRIPFGKGVCGEVWQSGQMQIVDDVHQHPNHIACSALSRSEIVVPVIDAQGKVTAVLDIDAVTVSAFDTIDSNELCKIATLI